MMRLDKYLAHTGTGTRTEAKKFIKAGRISVNGIIAKSGDLHIDEEKDEVTFDGRVLKKDGLRYFLLYKPAGFVTAVRDELHPTVMSLLAGENLRDCSPVGRLDIDTEGLLLITDDGQLSHRLRSPKHHIPKTYFARLDKPCPAQAIELFAEGVDIGDEKPTAPATLTIEQDGLNARLTIHEGRYHQVKRMFESVGCKVVYLFRESMGPLNLEGLSAGEYRYLTDDEIKNLWNL